MNIPQQFYKDQIDKHTLALKKVKKKLLISSITRLLVFVAVAASIYVGYPGTQIIVVSLAIGIMAFIFLVNRHSRLTYARNKLQQLIQINQLELDVFEGNKDQLTPGSEFINPAHPYSHDIDLFGNASFFQYTNRTHTAAGKSKLAAIFTANAITDIEKKQKAIQELSNLGEWRQDFGAIASLVDTTVPIGVIQKWIQNYTPFVPKIMQVLPLIISSISIIASILLFLEVITFNMFFLWFCVGLVITGTQLKKINALYVNASKAKDTFEQYYQLIEKIETLDFTSDVLKEKQQVIYSKKGRASFLLKQFASILNALDQRNNMIFGVLANGLLLWDIQQSYRIEQWIQRHHHKIDQWFEVIAFFDAYNSLGNFAFNHPQYIYPQITQDTTIINAKDLGHPMLNPTKRVDNDIRIDKEQFLITTGANMAGKSTFLRTIALQIVMANMGLPVCASSCHYRPIKLISSMRTSDSLSDDASYFFSELTQLKKIVNALQQDEYFIILDEILKGTNSKDKAAGSRQFVERLVATQATGIIATHDLSLCKIADTLPQVKNQYFDAQIVDDELYFDYKFKEGICQNMNASFLLKKMGIV